MAATPESIAGAGAAGSTGRLQQAFSRLDNQQKLMLMVSIAAVIALLVGSVLWFRQSDFRVLFSNISERDGGAIITALEQLNVPYKFSEGGGAILVPSNRVHEVRLRLASQGLPKGGSVGFELMENQKFGISQFAEQVNYQRALEGELSRTIQSIAAVQGARVHLAIPKPTVFVREEQKPSASVLLSLYPGRALEPAQIAGIQNLVASSVPQMPTANVAVLDQSGAVLSQLKSKLMDAGLDPTQVKYVHEVESAVIKRIEDILTPIVGPGNAKVQVAADIDFSQSEQTAETHKPNTTPPDIVVRSQQTAETASGTSTPAVGVPGALSNQPPVPATAPLTQPAVPGAAPAGATANLGAPGQINAAGVQAPIASIGQPVATTKNATINYEVDRTIRHTKQSAGVVRRLSAAVVVNHRKEIGKDGKPATKPLTDNELKQINDLAREAMGFSKDRGDTLSVANASFTAVERADDGLPLWKDPDLLSLLKDLIKYGAIAGIIAYLLLKVVKPLITLMLTPRPGEHAARGAAAYGAMAEEAGEGGPTPFEDKLDRARGVAEQDPKVVANIIKDWTGSNAS
ncbi:flagellar basal-body MS-ring/collar protein FliF [Azospira restricta]|uniref:Flagellar M-ring protein n=1 Tax=Azospira restricta TaxID=404405 RepID=A0A974SSE0_9RHOO|nr:flagellar basal-body MS-ring/collar protein FliF [Azospira restricta]QRJ65473.1 flagellar M-ring protein FliF [Azospira restricta]